MGDPLICERCGQEILPGADVEMIGMEDVLGQRHRRIYAGDEMVVVHRVCPEASAVSGAAGSVQRTVTMTLRLDERLLREQRDWVLNQVLGHPEDLGSVEPAQGLAELLDHMLDAMMDSGAPEPPLELTDDQAAVLRNALSMVTVGSWDPRGLPLPGTHDHAILEGILDQLQGR